MAQLAVACIQFVEGACLLGLAAYETQSSLCAFKLFTNADEVDIGPLKFSLRFDASKFELCNTCCFLQNRTPLDGACLQHGCNAALFNDAVGGVADAGIEKDVFDIFEPYFSIVDQVFAAAIAVEAATNGHLVGVNGKCATTCGDRCGLVHDWVFKVQCDRGHA